MDETTLIVVVVTAMSIYMMYKQITNYLKYKESYQQAITNHTDLKKAYFIKFRIFFMGLAIGLSIYLWWYQPNASSLAVVVLVGIMAISEVFSALMIGRVFYNDHVFFFNGRIIRYKNMKNVAISRNPMTAKVLLLNNEEVIIPKGAAKLIYNQFEAYKQGKKKK